MEINCKFETMGTFYYTCKITEANITEKNHVIKDFKGIHKIGKSHNQVQYIRFDATTVNYFPRGLQTHFPNVKYLVISDCDIKEITKNDLKGLGGLELLCVSKCQLATLPDDLLSEMPNLSLVSFSHNQIEFASSNLLKPLIGKEDVSVNLRKNKNIDAHYWPNVWPHSSDSLESIEDLMKLIDEKCMKPIVVPDPVDFDSILKEMWLEGRFSDLTIIAGEKKFKVHKTILGMQSEVFAQFFEEQPKAIELNISDFSSDSVEGLIKFVYTNEISRDGNAKENFEIANKFKIPAMKTFYEKIIFDQVDDSAEEIFLLAHRFSSQLLMKKAIHLIAEKFPELPIKILEDPEKLKKLIDARRDLNEIL